MGKRGGGDGGSHMESMRARVRKEGSAGNGIRRKYLIMYSIILLNMRLYLAWCSLRSLLLHWIFVCNISHQYLNHL